MKDELGPIWFNNIVCSNNAIFPEFTMRYTRIFSPKNIVSFFC